MSSNVALLVVSNARQSIQMSKNSILCLAAAPRAAVFSRRQKEDFRFGKQPLRLLVPVRDQVVGLGRIELPTSPLSGVRSSRLSYRPAGEASGFPASWWASSKLVELVGIEPATS